MDKDQKEKEILLVNNSLKLFRKQVQYKQQERKYFAVNSNHVIQKQTDCGKAIQIYYCKEQAMRSVSSLQTDFIVEIEVDMANILVLKVPSHTWQTHFKTLCLLNENTGFHQFYMNNINNIKQVIPPLQFIPNNESFYTIDDYRHLKEYNKKKCQRYFINKRIYNYVGQLNQQLQTGCLQILINESIEKQEKYQKELKSDEPFNHYKFHQMQYQQLDPAVIQLQVIIPQQSDGNNNNQINQYAYKKTEDKQFKEQIEKEKEHASEHSSFTQSVQVIEELHHTFDSASYNTSQNQENTSNRHHKYYKKQVTQDSYFKKMAQRQNRPRSQSFIDVTGVKVIKESKEEYIESKQQSRQVTRKFSLPLQFKSNVSTKDSINNEEIQEINNYSINSVYKAKQVHQNCKNINK